MKQGWYALSSNQSEAIFRALTLSKRTIILLSRIVVKIVSDRSKCSAYNVYISFSTLLYTYSIRRLLRGLGPNFLTNFGPFWVKTFLTRGFLTYFKYTDKMTAKNHKNSVKMAPNRY